jgi:hypothetical protein
VSRESEYGAGGDLAERVTCVDELDRGTTTHLDLHLDRGVVTLMGEQREAIALAAVDAPTHPS